MIVAGVELGPLFLRWNGIFLALGVACGALLAALEAHRRYGSAEIIAHIFTPVLVFGWLGARLWHIFTPPLSSVLMGLTTTHYLSHPLEILVFWIGGFGVPGALLGGMFGLWLNAHKDRLPYWHLTDVLSPGLLLAQIIGRFGNYFNQELYGPPTNLPWAIFILPENRLPGFENFEFYHPLFAYEMALNTLGLVLLLWLVYSKNANSLAAGEVFLTYLTYSSLTRFLLEPLRVDAALIAGVNVNQAFFAALFLITGGTLFLRRFLKKDSE